jgi:hypothetical protein
MSEMFSLMLPTHPVELGHGDPELMLGRDERVYFMYRG